MKSTTTIAGTVGADPRTGTFDDGRAYAMMRVAVNHDYFDRETGEFKDTGTSWFDVKAYGALAVNTGMSVKKGDSVVVSGRLRMREWESGGRSGMSPEIQADSIGLNLRFGTGSFRRTGAESRARGEDSESGSGDGGAGGGSAWGGFAGSPPVSPPSGGHAQAGDADSGESDSDFRDPVDEERDSALAGAGAPF